MEELEIEIKMEKGASLPVYATEDSAGLDLFANIEEDIELKPLERKLVPTGIYLSIPKGYEAEIRPRSGLAANYGITVLNSPGTIDADYRGEVKVLLINLGNSNFKIRKGERIAQIVFKPIVKVRFRIVEELPGTERGKKGFGSTGI